MTEKKLMTLVSDEPQKFSDFKQPTSRSSDEPYIAIYDYAFQENELDEIADNHLEFDIDTHSAFDYLMNASMAEEPLDCVMDHVKRNFSYSEKTKIDTNRDLTALVCKISDGKYSNPSDSTAQNDTDSIPMDFPLPIDIRYIL